MDTSKECPEERWPKKMLDWVPNRRRKRGKTQKNMEREYTARNGMEESTTRGLGEQERMASRMRETATAVKKPLIYIYIYKSLWELRWNEYIKVTLS